MQVALTGAAAKNGAPYAVLANLVSEAIEGFDPSEEFEQELRDRLLRAGEARAGVGPAPDPVSGEGPVSARDPVAATVD